VFVKVGYCRISTKSQNFDLQEDALLKDGCEKIFRDIVSGAKSKRPGLDDMLSQLRRDDIVVVYKLDRLGRSLKHLVDLINDLSNEGIGLRSLNDPVDTTSPQGLLITNIFASIAEFERQLTQERTKAELEAARSRGRVGGRPKGLSEEAEKTAMVAETLYKEGRISVQEIANRIGVTKPTLYRYLRHRGVNISAYKRNS